MSCLLLVGWLSFFKKLVCYIFSKYGTQILLLIVDFHGYIFFLSYFLFLFVCNLILLSQGATCIDTMKFCRIVADRGKCDADNIKVTTNTSTKIKKDKNAQTLHIKKQRQNIDSVDPFSVNVKLSLLNSGSVLPHLPENTGKGDQWPEDRSAQILDAHDKYLKIKLKYWVLSTKTLEQLCEI